MNKKQTEKLKHIIVIDTIQEQLDEINKRLKYIENKINVIQRRGDLI